MATVTGMLITTAGQAKIAADLSGGADLVLTHVAWGDANGVPYDPLPAQTALGHEKYRATIAAVAVVENAIVIDAILPANTPDALARASHSFNVAECGLFDAAGTLIAVARMGNGFKPAPSSGQAVVATYRLKIAVANPAAISVVIDPQAQIALGREVRPQWLTVDGVINTPPASPAQGATYVIGSAPTGAWTGFAGRLAQWIGVWSLATAPAGHIVADASAAEASALRYLKYTGAAWVSALVQPAGNAGFINEEILRSQRSNYFAGAQVGGTANAITLTLAPQPASWTDLVGVPLRAVIGTSNSGAVTVGVGGLSGTKPLVRRNAAALAAGDLIAGAIATIIYDGTRFRLASLSWSDALDAASSMIAGTPLTRYVRTGGADTNDGLANTDASAYKTPQAAINEVYWKYGATRSLIVQLGVAGTYAAPSSVPKNMVITIKGDAAANSGYILDSAGGSSRSLLMIDSSDIRLEGVALSPSWAGRHVIDAYGSGSRVQLVDSRFAVGSASPGALIRAAANGEVRIDGTLTVASGGANAFLAVLGGSIVIGAASSVAFSGAPAFTVVASCDAGLIGTQGVAITGTATGTRYNVNMNGVIRVNGAGENYFPGDVAGTFANGGVYA